MVHIHWKDRYNINFREIDAQHRGLLDLLNELIDQMDGRRDSQQVARIFHDLCDYALTHFSTEERYMAAAAYPRLAEHRREHEGFVAKVLELSRGYDPGDPHLVDEMADFLKHWYLEHIMKMDQDYVPFLQRALPTDSIKGVILGLDRVLCSRDPAPLVRLVAERCGKPEAAVQGALGTDPGYLAAVESGAADPGRFASELGAWAGATFSPEELARAYGEGFHPVPAMVQLVRGLREHLQVALVGDAAPWLRGQGFQRLGIRGLFHAEVLSSDIGRRLPDPALFTQAAARLNLSPGACLLIHKDTACLESAQGAKVQTLQYTNPVMLMAELRRMAVAF